MAVGACAVCRGVASRVGDENGKTVVDSTKTHCIHVKTVKE